VVANGVTNKTLTCRWHRAAGGEGERNVGPYSLFHEFFRIPDLILKNEETLEAVLALAPEIDAYRGKGSQILQKAFNQHLGGLLYTARLEDFEEPPSPDLFAVAPTT
jgi:hypothetical protein